MGRVTSHVPYTTDAPTCQRTPQGMLSEKEKLDALTQLGIELNLVQDLDLLMELILSEARRFVNADAGSIYMKDGDQLNFTYTQNNTLQKRLNIGEKLIYATFSIPVDKTSMAGYVAATGRPLNLEDVYQIDAQRPFRFSRKFDEASDYTTRSALTLPLKTPEGKVLGVLQIINALDDAGRCVAFSRADEKVMTLFASIAAVAVSRAKLTRAMILRMIQMAEMRDPHETGDHVNRVAGYAVEIYEKWAGNHHHTPEEIHKNRDTLRMAAMLHDVGKIAISDLILKKPSRFDLDEYEVMKMHTVFGARLFQDQQSDYDVAAAQVALNHHERWDGQGYPGQVDVAASARLEDFPSLNRNRPGKKGCEIPIFGRIVSLADVYDALCSQRVYKEAWDEERALSAIEQSKGRQFDPELVDIFLNNIDMIRSIQQRYIGRAQ